MDVPGAFDYLDSTNADGLLMRLEFIRSYMEEGLEAIQPHPDAIKAGLVRKPSGFKEDNRPLKRKLLSPAYWAYMFAAGQWVDAYIKRKADAYVWPEEVERLCAPGADLSGYDTRPVKSYRNMFYRYRGMNVGFEFVDANGRKLSTQPSTKA